MLQGTPGSDQGGSAKQAPPAPMAWQPQCLWGYEMYIHCGRSAHWVPAWCREWPLHL